MNSVSVTVDSMGAIAKMPRLLIVGLLMSGICVAGDEDTEEQLNRVVADLQARGHLATREKLFAKAVQDKSDGGTLLREASEWLRAADMEDVAVIDKPWANWTSSEWKSLEEDVARLDPAYTMVAKAVNRPVCNVHVLAHMLPPLAWRMHYKAILEAHQKDMQGALDVLKGQLTMALSIHARAEVAAVSRAGVLDAFFHTVQDVESVESLPAIAFHEALEPLLKNAGEKEIDLGFEIQTMGVWVLESQKPSGEKLKRLEEIREVMAVVNSGTEQDDVAKGLPASVMGRVASRLIRGDREARAQVQLARLGLALLDHRERNGQWPEKLADLQPKFGALPLDPLTGMQFEYRKLKGGVKIRSVAKPSEGALLSWEFRDR